MPINKKSIYLKELEAVRAETYQTVSTYCHSPHSTAVNQLNHLIISKLT